MNRAMEPKPGSLALALLVAIVLSSCAGSPKSADAASVSAVPARAPDPTPRWTAAKGTALIVMDMQRGYMPIANGDQVFANIQGLVDAARGEGAKVIWVYTDYETTPAASEAFEVAPPLAPLETEFRVVKTTPSVFRRPEFEKYLGEQGIGRLVFCGIASDACVRASVATSLYTGYRTVVASDAHSVVAHPSAQKDIESMNALWEAGGYVELLPASSVDFSRP